MSKPAANPKPLYAVLRLQAGSLLLGEHKFIPFEVQAVPAEARELACPQTTPLRFFATREEAEAEVRALRAESGRSAPAPPLRE